MNYVGIELGAAHNLILSSKTFNGRLLCVGKGVKKGLGFQWFSKFSFHQNFFQEVFVRSFCLQLSLAAYSVMRKNFDCNERVLSVFVASGVWHRTLFFP